MDKVLKEIKLVMKSDCDCMDHETFESYQTLNPDDDDEVNDFFATIFEKHNTSENDIKKVINIVREDLWDIKRVG